MTIYARRRRRRLNQRVCVFVRTASSSCPAPLCDFVSYFHEKKSLQTDSSEKIANLPGSFLVPLRKKVEESRDKLLLLYYMRELSVRYNDCYS